MTRHNPFSSLFDNLPWPIIDTRPNQQTYIMYGPGHPKNDVYRDDMAKFSALGVHRHSFIRQHCEKCELSPTGWDTKPAKLLAAWCVIVRISPGSYFELPFWRGPAPYAVEPNTDVEVAAIVAECVAVGGYDQTSLAEWRKALAVPK